MNAENETHKVFVNGHFLNGPPLITYLLIPRGLAVQGVSWQSEQSNLALLRI